MQAGVLPVRQQNGRIEVLLITSRTVGRWILPKGNVKRHQTPIEAALQEAYEEAGIRGRIDGAAGPLPARPPRRSALGGSLSDDGRRRTGRLARAARAHPALDAAGRSPAGRL
ncbi:NUDIX hydrolase [Rhodothermus marinus]|uniref:NUDIX hydrolase n=1 Tax=Rhodothermus marinus TaxID=29549 RepID=UPI001FB1C6B5|nr:NUDIX domain-containing protein [Rhodothermus marinus]